MKMGLINKFIVAFIILSLYSCSEFETKLSRYMERDLPSCTDTTYWRVVDLQDVLGVKYDRLYIIGSNFEDDIAKGTRTNWKDGDFLSWDKDLLLLAKENKVVFKDEIEKADGSFYSFDKYSDSKDTIIYPLSERPTSGCKLFDTSTIYYIRVDIIRGKSYYTLYNKNRMEHGKSFFEPCKWLYNRNSPRTPWGHGMPPQNKRE